MFLNSSFRCQRKYACPTRELDTSAHVSRTNTRTGHVSRTTLSGSFACIEASKNAFRVVLSIVTAVLESIRLCIAFLFFTTAHNRLEIAFDTLDMCFRIQTRLAGASLSKTAPSDLLISGLEGISIFSCRAGLVDEQWSSQNHQSDKNGQIFQIKILLLC